MEIHNKAILITGASSGIGRAVAVKLAAKNNRIAITAREERGRVLICVRDNGEGIEPQNVAKIFDPFFTTRDIGKGMGMGLSICYRILQEHRGSISVQSERGRYCEFIVELPSARAEAQATAAEKDIIDATRAGNVSAAQDALARLRTSGSGDSYRTYEGIVNGTIQDIPTTPVMRAMVSDRLADPGNPLTRQELNTWLADGRVSQTLVAETLPRIRERENADFREAEAFVGRALNVPSGTIADRDLQPWQRQARLLSGQILNDLVVERQRNPGLDPLKYVRERLANDPTPQQNLAAQRNAEALRRMPPQVNTRDGLNAVQAQVDAWVGYQRLGWWEKQQTPTPPRPPTINGAMVTQQDLTRWRGILDAAGAQ